ncbi:MAG: hypothetical protein ABIS50_26660 [Luteolibacter sp.]|uniref:hypothetical protein n=1 Tax=Luteolibacter sp. TaxID=1962973 RepID=UPI003266EE7B
MTDPNPYAPPATLDPEAPSSLLWQLDGTTLLVKNSAVLPRVDLETGETTGEMKAVRRILQRNSGLFPILRVVIVVAVIRFLPDSFHDNPLLLYLALFGVFFLLKQGQALRGNPSQRIFIWEFVGPRTQHGRMVRNKWRIAIYLLGMTSLLTSFVPSLTRDLEVGFRSGGFAIILINLIWRLIDRPKARTQAGPPGWLKISPIHHDAVSFLSPLQKESYLQSGQASARGKLMHTTYFHRYPLAMLVGKRKNPFTLFNLFLAKLLRSHQLRRDTYHFSEAETRALAELSQHLQDQAASWIASHPGWHFLSGTQLVFPAGDVILETAHLASPGLDHQLAISASWNVALPGYIPTQSSFTTWLADGTSIVTHERPFLPLRIPGIQEFRASGNPDAVFQSHLHHLAGKPLDPPKDPQEFLSRLDAHRAATDRRLTELGYQSETREVR